MNYNIVATGSAGNCLVLDGTIAVDMGVSYKSLRPYVKSLQLVLLTHAHGDHCNRSTINTIYNDRPLVRFAVPEWLRFDHTRNAKNIDTCAMHTWYDYGIARVQPFPLYHDVPNCGWLIEYKGKRIFYATDTCHLDGMTARNYDFYFIEANYTLDDIKERIEAKESAREYVNEYRTMQTHLSKEQADAWIMENAGDHSTIEYMHGHKEAK